MDIWCDCRFSEDLAHRENVDALLVAPKNSVENTHGIPTFAIETGHGKVHDQLMHDGKLIGIMVNLTEEKGQQTALSAVGSVEWILAYTEGEEGSWRMIPAENLIGAATQSGTKIAFVVERVQDVVGLSRALQVGVDALCVASDASQELWDAVLQARQRRQDQTGSTLELSTDNPQDNTLIVTGRCWRTALSSSSSSVVSDRVCIDFVRVLEPTEGCWIGSSAKIMSLVLSEAATSSFVPSRPFRVNAGPVHSYVCLGDGVKTKYLCELQAGDEVFVYNAATGSSRAVAVGRLKIEVRPCVLVSFEEEGKDGETQLSKGQIFLQQAETVRLGKEGGNFVRVTDLQLSSPEDSKDKSIPILLRITSTGTHIGGRYEGEVTEK